MCEQLRGSSGTGQSKRASKFGACIVYMSGLAEVAPLRSRAHHKAEGSSLVRLRCGGRRVLKGLLSCDWAGGVSVTWPAPPWPPAERGAPERPRGRTRRAV